MKLLFPFDKAGLINLIRVDGKIHSEEYTAEGILVDALVDVKIFSKVEQYKIAN
jgi:GTP-binding protein HflX